MIKKIQLFIFLLLVATNISANNKEFKITNNNDKTIYIVVIVILCLILLILLKKVLKV